MGSETSQQRFAACKSMLDYGFATYAVVWPQSQENMTVPVRLGTADTATAVLSEQAPMLVDKGQKSMVSTRVELEESVTAPVSRGQRLGTLEVVAGEQVLARLPLVAEQSVEKLSWGQMFLRQLKMAAFG